MAIGYSSAFVSEVKEANSSKLGVQLALICIRRDIPVKDVAEYFGVSRMTIYSWFRGKTTVPTKHREKIQNLIDKLS